jgi:hypothetical protein
MFTSRHSARRRRRFPFLARITRASHRNHFIAGISSEGWSAALGETSGTMVVCGIVVDSSSARLAGWCWRAVLLGVHGSMIVDWIVVVVNVTSVEALLLREGSVRRSVVVLRGLCAAILLLMILRRRLLTLLVLLLLLVILLALPTLLVRGGSIGFGLSVVCRRTLRPFVDVCGILAGRNLDWRSRAVRRTPTIELCWCLNVTLWPTLPSRPYRAILRRAIW